MEMDPLSRWKRCSDLYHLGPVPFWAVICCSSGSVAFVSKLSCCMVATLAFPVDAPLALRVYEGGGELFRDPLTFSDDSGSSGAGSQKQEQDKAKQQQKAVSAMCPVPTFVSLWTMRANGLPIDLSPQVPGQQ